MNRHIYRNLMETINDIRLSEQSEHSEQILNEESVLDEATTTKEIKVGDIFYASWGYEQTNITFFKVTKLVGTQTLELQELNSIQKSDGPQTMTGTSTPGTKLVGQPIRKRLATGVLGDPEVKIKNYMVAKLWDGKPKQFSSYA